MTVLIDKLVSLGYVTKEKSIKDSRVTFIRLTPTGLDLKPVFIEVSEIVNAIVYKDLSEEEVNSVEAILEKIKQNLGE